MTAHLQHIKFKKLNANVRGSIWMIDGTIVTLTWTSEDLVVVVTTSCLVKTSGPLVGTMNVSMALPV